MSDEEVPEPRIVKVEDSRVLDLVGNAVRSQECILFLEALTE